MLPIVWRDERDRESRDRDDERGGLDPRDVFMRDLDLPGGRERERVHDRYREYTMSGSDTRALSTIGTFRVVPEGDLRDSRDATFDERDDLRPSIPQLRAAILAYVDAHNDRGTPFRWVKTADEILEHS